jgi:hypothetical protein
MDEPETFRIEGMDVSVEESTDTLTYTFKPKDPASQPSVPFGLVVPLMIFPLGLLGLVGYAYSKTANRPEWEEILTGVFVVQMLVWFVVGAVESILMFRWTLHSRTVVRFTHTHVWHTGDRVCEFEEVRGLRLFTYPATAERFDPEGPGKLEACLSLVIGEDGSTHGLFGGFDELQLRKLADDMHRRLAKFRFDQGIVAALEAISVVETTQDEAVKLMHTRPARGAFRMFASGAFSLLLSRVFGTMWCLAMFAGLYASGRLVAAAGFSGAFLLGHSLVGFVHFALLMAIWGQSSRQTPPQKQAEPN